MVSTRRNQQTHHSGRLSSSRKFFRNATFFSPSVSITRWLNGPATQRQHYIIMRNTALLRRSDEPGPLRRQQPAPTGLPASYQHCMTGYSREQMKVYSGAQSRVVPSVSWLPLFGAPLMYLEKQQIRLQMRVIAETGHEMIVKLI